MNVLVKNARIFDGKTESGPLDVWVRDGVIAGIGERLQTPENTERWEAPGLCVSPGWMDVGVQLCDPGFEHREDLRSGVAAGMAGGFTALACFPNTQPTLHSKSEILYIKNKADALNAPVDVYPIGAISQGCEGKDLAEMMEMNSAGACAFSDGRKAVQDAGLLLRALQYAQAFGGLIFNEPHHKTIAAGGQMHEGIISTSLGLKGIPALAEELMVQRDLSLLEYAGGRLHIHLISTAKSVELIRAAKKKGLQVSCSVAVANLCFSDEQLRHFDSNWKILPPLRGADDLKALRKGLADGVIDFICSNHTPWDEEAKNLEFPYAEFGMTGMETLFPWCRSYLDKQLDINDIVEKIACAPRRVLGIPAPQIAVGAAANLTVFQPDAEWTPNAAAAHSKSKNYPLYGHALKGRVYGVLHKARAGKQA